MHSNGLMDKAFILSLIIRHLSLLPLAVIQMHPSM